MNKNQKKILVIGATSEIAFQLSRLYALNSCEFFLVARNEDRLNQICSDLLVRGANKVSKCILDVFLTDRYSEAIENAYNTLGKIDIAVVAHGTLPEQKEVLADIQKLSRQININYTSVVLLTSLIAKKMTTDKTGIICVISSVAGDRGRKSNYIYGSCKGGVSAYLQGLRNDLYPNVHVLTIKPGFVITPMTRHFKKGILWVSAKRVAHDIAHAINKRRDVVYTPWFWFWIMLIIKLIPEKLFKRLSL